MSTEPSLVSLVWRHAQLYRCILQRIVIGFLLVFLILVQFGSWLHYSSQAQPVDAIVVLGGEHPTRIAHGITLYNQGLARELWHTGNIATSQINDSYAQIARRLAIHQGVPKQAIHLLNTTNTWEDGQAIADLAMSRNIQSIIVVTSWYHSRRSFCVLQKQLEGRAIDVYISPAPSSRYNPNTWWCYRDAWFLVGRELAAMIMYWWHYDVDFVHC